MNYIDRYLNAKDELDTLKRILHDQNMLDEAKNNKLRANFAKIQLLEKRVEHQERENHTQGSVIIALRNKVEEL